MPNIRNWREIIASLLFLALLVALSVTGVWRNGNLTFSDWLFNSGLVAAEADPQVLLVELDGPSVQPQALSTLVSELDALGARASVLLPPAQPPSAQAAALATDSLLVTRFAGEYGTQVPDGEAWLYQGTGTSWVTTPQFDAGYFRAVPAGFVDQGINQATAIPAWFVTVQGGERDLADAVALNFAFLENGLPTLNQRQILAGEVIPELVQGRVVLMATADPTASPGYQVPGAAEPLNNLQIQGLAWATVAADAELRFPAPLWIGLVVGLIFLFNLFVFQWLSVVNGALYSLVVLVGFGLLGWWLLEAFDTLPPVADVTAAQLVSLLFVYQARRYTEAKTLTTMLGTTHSALFERYVPEAFNDSESPWPKLVVFINQQLNLSRTILLERVPGDHRVREIQALNCSIDDIAEQRRDYERTPYSDALQHRGALQLRRAFLERKGDHELEYLTPLIYAGEVLGFWALSVVPEENWSQEAFENNIASFASQISELLYHRQQLERERARQRRLGRRILALNVGRTPHEQLHSAQELLGNRLLSLEAMFDNLDTGAIMYDLFGQVLQVNARALEIAGEAKLSVYRMTALDFLCGLCDLSQDDARRQLRHATLKRALVRLPVKPINGYQGLILLIRPISEHSDRPDGRTGAGLFMPFKLLGLSFELVDMSHTRKALGFRDDLLHQLALAIRDRLSRATLAARLAAPELTPLASGQRVLSALRGTVEGIEKSLTQVEEQMEDRREALRLASTTPVNLVRLVEDALLRNQSPLNEKRIDLASDWPYAPSLVWADAEVLSRVLDRVLVLLLKDATPDGRLFITLSEHLEPRQQARLVLSNEGYGLPQQTLDRIWNQSVADLVDSDDPLEETMGMLKSLESWGGRAQVSTRVGKGFRLEMDFSTLGFRDEQILSERGHDPVGNQMQSGHDNDNS